MSAPLRFLAFLAVGWVGVRAATLGMLPGFTVGYAKPRPLDEPPPMLQATEFPPLPPVEQAPAPDYAAAAQAYGYPAAQMAMPMPMPMPAQVQVPVPYYVPVQAYSAALPQQPVPQRAAWQLPSSRGDEAPAFYTPIAPIDEWSLTEIQTAAYPGRRSVPAPQAIGVTPQKPPLDRLQMSSWALLRGAPGVGSLASGGTLGGSQAGARLTYAFNHWVAASLRTTSPVGGSRGAEVAGGVRLTPFRSIPFSITAERRQAISPHGGGRSAFAVFVEGGLYRQPMPLDFNLDAYVQAGVVGLNRRDLFADGAMTFTRPVWGRFSAGFGVWGGAQPGIYRVDAGPRLSIRIRDNIHAHVDWRQRLAGNAEPSSGPALTLAADF